MAFDQDLGWCVTDDVYLSYAFYYTQCYSGNSATSATCTMPHDVDAHRVLENAS